MEDDLSIAINVAILCLIAVATVALVDLTAGIIFEIVRKARRR